MTHIWPFLTPAPDEIIYKNSEMDYLKLEDEGP